MCGSAQIRSDTEGWVRNELIQRLWERCETQVEKDEAILLLKLFYQKTVEGNKGRVWRPSEGSLMKSGVFSRQEEAGSGYRRRLYHIFRSEQCTVRSNTHQVLSCNHICFKCSVSRTPCSRTSYRMSLHQHIIRHRSQWTGVRVTKISPSRSVQNMISASHCWEL